MNGTACFKNVNKDLNTNIYSYLRHLVVKVLIYIYMLFIFSTTVLIRHLWTALFLHRCLKCIVLLSAYVTHIDELCADEMSVDNKPCFQWYKQWQ
jgi:hypothetical protein